MQDKSFSIGGQVVRFAVLVLLIAAMYVPFFFLNQGQVYPLISEAGVYQAVTAIAFLAAGIVMLIAFGRGKRGNNFVIFETRRNLFVVLLGIVFIIGAGEELSWGQHILGYEVPDAVANANRQREFNLHNLNFFDGRNDDGSLKTGASKLLTISGLFSLFWLSFCVCIPLLDVVSNKVRRLISHVQLPLVPLWIGMVFPANYLFAKYAIVLSGHKIHYVAEVKETGFSILFLLFCVTYYNQQKTRTEKYPPTSRHNTP